MLGPVEVELDGVANAGGEIVGREVESAVSYLDGMDGGTAGGCCRCGRRRRRCRCAGAGISIAVLGESQRNGRQDNGKRSEMHL